MGVMTLCGAVTGRATRAGVGGAARGGAVVVGAVTVVGGEGAVVGATGGAVVGVVVTGDADVDGTLTA